MYSMRKHFNVDEAAEFIGLGRSRTLRLCQQRTHGFPAVKVGNKYQINADKLSAWYEDWFAGKFDINS